MHVKRQSAMKKLPIPRKGTKYIARALSNVSNSLPVVIAVRDMLHLAHTASEVKKMIIQKMLKINGRVIKDQRESVSLFNILEAGKSYKLSLLPTGKFTLEEAKDKSIRLCKVINKKLVKKNSIQLNFHDGSNLISKENIQVGDSVYLDSAGKIKKHVALEKGKEAMIISGKYIGQKGKINSKNARNLGISLDNEKLVSLDQSQVIVE